ncbi:MAG: ribosome small subunit-dependent GTPase A [Syntrophomonadaceae bacterium]|nr:ribosome small subunit-dependent GTPase A [Syntrophomonadaceae bacterium]
MTRDAGEKSVNGLIIKRYSGFYYVQTQDNRIFECKLRGKLKDGRLLVGDRVKFTLTGSETGIIDTVLARDAELRRPAIANVNQVLVVMSYVEPIPNLHLLDRLLILIENQGLEAVIVLNKCDLAGNEQVETIIEYYTSIGYPVVSTSTKKNIGIQELADIIKGSITVLAGPSGVGKTSLLNVLIPGMEMKTDQVSRKLARGKHTTRHVELFPLISGGWLADTPGFGVVDLPAMKREELKSLFRGFSQLAEKCRFINCIHAGEKECGVKDAVEKGVIPASRYQSYMIGLTEIIEKERSY